MTAPVIELVGRGVGGGGGKVRSCFAHFSVSFVTALIHRGYARARDLPHRLCSTNIFRRKRYCDKAAFLWRKNSRKVGVGSLPARGTR